MPDNKQAEQAAPTMEDLFASLGLTLNETARTTDPTLNKVWHAIQTGNESVYVFTTDATDAMLAAFAARNAVVFQSVKSAGSIRTTLNNKAKSAKIVAAFAKIQTLNADGENVTVGYRVSKSVKSA